MKRTINWINHPTKKLFITCVEITLKETIRAFVERKVLS
jgi:hypothetical protein